VVVQPATSTEDAPISKEGTAVEKTQVIEKPFISEPKTKPEVASVVKPVE